MKTGTQREPLLEDMEGRFGHHIKVGDRVVTFTQACRATRVDDGIYCGVVREKNAYGTEWVYYIVERKDGKRSRLSYNGIVPETITIKDLIGHTI
jgi:hypothetical protein